MSDFDDWADEQFRKRGWSESEIKTGHKYEKWGFRLVIGGLLCIFVIGIPIGLPLFLISLPMVLRHKNPGKAYNEEKKELRKEFKRRDKSGEPKFDDVDPDWWENRLADPTH